MPTLTPADPFYVDYLASLAGRCAALQATLTGLDAAGLNWIPAPGMNSLAVLASHAAGSTRYWIGDVVGRSSSGRVRSAEFQAHAANPVALQAHIEVVLEHARQVVGALNLADLATLRLASAQERQVTVGWALLHALEHLAEHVGHAQLVRELWDKRGN